MNDEWKPERVIGGQRRLRDYTIKKRTRLNARPTIIDTMVSDESITTPLLHEYVRENLLDIHGGGRYWFYYGGRSIADIRVAGDPIYEKTAKQRDNADAAKFLIPMMMGELKKTEADIERMRVEAEASRARAHQAQIQAMKDEIAQAEAYDPEAEFQATSRSYRSVGRRMHGPDFWTESPILEHLANKIIAKIKRVDFSGREPFAEVLKPSPRPEPPVIIPPGPPRKKFAAPEGLDDW